jgi:hypothetical protein
VKIFCCYTPAHQRLFEEFFKPSLDPAFELHATRLDVEGPGDFLSPEFIRCILKKIDLILESLAENSGEIIVWSDIDILFLKPIAAELEKLMNLSAKDILLQSEGRAGGDVNTGFFVCRASGPVIDLFKKARDEMRGHPGINEQLAVNRILPGSENLGWERLPLKYYARTHGCPPGSDIVLYHANLTPGGGGVGQKIAQFRELQWVRRHGLPALAWSCLRRFPEKLAKGVSGFLSQTKP